MPIYSIKETGETSARTLLLLKIMEMTNHSRDISKIEQGIYLVAHQMYNFFQKLQLYFTVLGKILRILFTLLVWE